MPRQPVPLVVFFFLCALFAPLVARTQQRTDARRALQLLATGDSLYRSHRYLEAFSVYSTLYEQERQFTPRMLLKMASIQEGAGNHAATLYFLTEHYRHTYDRNVREKILDIAEANALRGHIFGDEDYFLRWWRRCRGLCMILLLAACAVFLGLIVRVSLIGRRSFVLFFYLFFCVLCSGILVFEDLLFRRIRAIATENAPVVDGPSPAAARVDDIRAGEKVAVTEGGGVWTAITWRMSDGGAQKGYIRTKSLLVLR